jgi:hypothetical protein
VHDLFKIILHSSYLTESLSVILGLVRQKAIMREGLYRHEKRSECLQQGAILFLLHSGNQWEIGIHYILPLLLINDSLRVNFGEVRPKAMMREGLYLYQKRSECPQKGAILFGFHR